MDKRYEIFTGTVRACATPVYAQSEEEFRYVLFEKLSIEVFSFFSEVNLDDLIAAGKVRPEDKEDCLQIRVLFENNEKHWRELGDVKTIDADPSFADIRRIAGKLVKIYSGYSLLDKETEDKLWDKIFGEYRFVPNCVKEPYPWIQLPQPCRSFRLKNVWNDEQEALVNSFFVQSGAEKLYALDWHHDCFSFDPKDFGRLIKEYHDEDCDCNVYFPSYYPNGDYYFFVEEDWKCALFGHPWISEIVVYGQELIGLFEANKEELDLGNNMLEELYMVALLWVIGRIPREEYVCFLEDIYMLPENKDNDFLLRLEEANGNITDTNHVFSQSIQYGPEKWDEEAIVRKIVETLNIHYRKKESVLDTIELGYSLVKAATLSLEAVNSEPLVLILRAADYLDEEYFYPETGCKSFMQMLHYYSEEPTREEIDEAIAIVRKEAAV